MDVIVRDDDCGVRTDHAPANFTTIKHLAHNLIRKAPGKASLRLKRKAAGWHDFFLVSLLVHCLRPPDSPAPDLDRPLGLAPPGAAGRMLGMSKVFRVGNGAGFSVD